MVTALFDDKVLKIEGLETKFDIIPVSNSLVTLLGDYIEARIVQQLHYWCYQGYGVVIDGIRRIHKPVRELIEEAFPASSSWKLNKAISSLIEKGIINREKLFTKHHEIEHDDPYWHPKNQTYYYSLNYEKIQELVQEYQDAQTPENSVSKKTQKLSFEDFSTTKFSDCPKNKTKNTPKENLQKKSHPTLPCESEKKKPKKQEKQEISKTELSEVLERPDKRKVNSLSSKAISKEISSERVEQKINANKCTNKQFVQETVQKTEIVQKDVQVSEEIKSIAKTKPKTPKGARSHSEETSLGSHLKGTKSNRKDKAPWKDEGEFKRFYRVLLEYAKVFARNPQGLVQHIITKLRRGEPDPCWDDFKAGLPIGTSTQQEWELEPGVPYPMFVEYLAEKVRDPHDSTEKALEKAFRVLDKPKQAKAFWGHFKRSVVNVAEQVERDRALGVSNPNTPVWIRERIEPSIEEAKEAGQKIMAVNHDGQILIEAANKPQLESVEPSRGLQAPESNSGDSPSPNQLSEPPTSDPWTEDNQSLTIKELLSQSKVKGFGLAMPKVSSETAEAEAKAESEALRKQRMNRKTHINQMSIDEINELLTDPIVRKELTSQIILNNKFDVVTDNLGEVLAVKISQEYLDSGGT